MIRNSKIILLSAIFLSGCQSFLPVALQTNPVVATTATEHMTTNVDAVVPDTLAVEVTDIVEFIDNAAQTITPLSEVETLIIIADVDKSTPALPMPFDDDASVLAFIETVSVYALPDKADAITVKLDGSDYAYRHIPTLFPNDLWLSLRKNFQLDLNIDQPRLASQYAYYSKHQGYINRVSDRASRYIYYVKEQIEARGMPAEIALLPVVESGFDPFAYSHGRASGMWQFIPSTGRIYDLRQDWWYDGRRDVVASTNAALDFLESLAKRFDGDWLLALAAYNSGGGTVNKAMRANRNKGLPTDFWSLDLPPETEAYVPKLLAIAKIIWDPRAANLTLPSIADQPYFAAVDVGGQIDLAQAARISKVDLDEIYLLNPGFNQWATSPDGPHSLLVPIAAAPAFAAAMVDIPSDQRISWARYEIQSGDSLSTIASAHNTTLQVIRDVNNLTSDIIVAGKTLMIPSASSDAEAYALSASQRLATKQSKNPDSSGLKQHTHVVSTGDNFWDISRSYDVDMRALARWNNMAPTDILFPGQELVVWMPRDQSASTVADARSIIRKVGYTVRSGDSLARIADRFNVTVSQIHEWNTISGKYIQPGQGITLYVDVTQNQ